MKYLILLILASPVMACDEIYLKVGTGYKFDEQNRIQVGENIYYYENSPYSARFETGVECGNLTYGIGHHSQWATGFPLNDTGEYYKTEFFIDYGFYVVNIFRHYSARLDNDLYACH